MSIKDEQITLAEQYFDEFFRGEAIDVFRMEHTTSGKGDAVSISCYEMNAMRYAWEANPKPTWRLVSEHRYLFTFPKNSVNWDEVEEEFDSNFPVAFDVLRDDLPEFVSNFVIDQIRWASEAEHDALPLVAAQGLAITDIKDAKVRAFFEELQAEQA